jgi:hypothetical protein
LIWEVFISEIFRQMTAWGEEAGDNGVGWDGKEGQVRELQINQFGEQVLYNV